MTKIDVISRLLSPAMCPTLFWQFVRLKMDYNKTRPTRHGKRY